MRNFGHRTVATSRALPDQRPKRRDSFKMKVFGETHNLCNYIDALEKLEVKLNVRFIRDSATPRPRSLRRLCLFMKASAGPMAAWKNNYERITTVSSRAESSLLSDGPSLRKCSYYYCQDRTSSAAGAAFLSPLPPPLSFPRHHAMQPAFRLGRGPAFDEYGFGKSPL
jgi:hypothetical protein